MINKIASLSFLGCIFMMNAAIACEGGHSIMGNFDHGKVIKLDDNTLWQIDPSDQVDTAVWVQGNNIVVCGDSLINTDENETVQATQISQ